MNPASQAVSEPVQTRAKLGTRIAARFAGMGLTEPLPSFRGQTIDPMAQDALLTGPMEPTNERSG